MQRIDFPFCYKGNYVYSKEELLQECSYDLNINISKLVDDIIEEQSDEIDAKYEKEYTKFYETYIDLERIIKNTLPDIIKKLTEIDENSEVDLYYTIEKLQELVNIANRNN